MFQGINSPPTKFLRAWRRGFSRRRDPRPNAIPGCIDIRRWSCGGRAAELAQHKDDPRYCVTHTQTASALDRCVRAQHGERQMEDYDYVPGNGSPAGDHRPPPDCEPGYWLSVAGCQKR